MKLSKLEAELYTLTHRGNTADVRFYADSCRKSRRVLELGSGYGRLIPSLLQIGNRNSPRSEVWGIEREPRLLAAAKLSLGRLRPEQRKRVRLIAGDMRDFALGVTFDSIILPYNGLYCLLNRRDLLRCLTCVQCHLASGGEFLFDVWAADRFHRMGATRAFRDDPGAILSIAHRSQIWDLYEKSRLRSRDQRLDVVYTYVSRERGTCVSIPIAQRYAPSTELRSLLTSVGFQITSVFGDFAQSRYGPSSEHFVVRAHKR